MLCHSRKQTVRPRAKRALSLALAALIALPAAGSLAFAESAHADVRRADVVLGQSVESRGLSVAQCPNIEAQHAIVMDSDGMVYFERDATAPVQIASITKVMTAIVAMETMSYDDTVVVSESAASIGESSAELQAGDSMTLKTAMKAMLLASGNEAAESIAEAGGRVLLNNPSASSAEASAAFVERMNTLAAEIGMKDSVFENPHGLDFDQYTGNLHSTAYDVATMCAYAMRDEVFARIVALPSDVITVTRNGAPVEIALTSTDILIGSYEGACGIKTGFTALAGACFAGACNRDGTYYYAICLNSPDETQRFRDTQALFDWVYEHEIKYSLANCPETTTMSKDGVSTDVPLVASVAHQGWIDRTVKATLSDPDAFVEVNDLNGNVSQEVSFANLDGDVRVGDTVGTVTFKQRNQVIATCDLVATEEVLAPNLFEGIGVWWDRLFRGFRGEDRVAQSAFYNTTPLLNDKTAA